MSVLKPTRGQTEQERLDRVEAALKEVGLYAKGAHAEFDYGLSDSVIINFYPQDGPTQVELYRVFWISGESDGMCFECFCAPGGEDKVCEHEAVWV